MSTQLYGAIELGGTKVNCAVGRGPDRICVQGVIPTTLPDETLTRVRDFFTDAMRAHGALQGLGVACFGPVDLDVSSPTHGHILQTPKAGWSRTDVLSAIAPLVARPVVFETDVNAAAWGEGRWGAGAGLSDFVYVTVGTGIGGGAVVGGRLLHGLGHAEMGHMLTARIPGDDYPGICSFHGDCLEGLACGPALAARWGQSPEDLPDDHPAWELEARYLAMLCLNLTAVLAPGRIILGGGVMARAALLDKIRGHFAALSNGYFAPADKAGGLEAYIVAAALGSLAGLIGAFSLVQDG